MGVALLFATAVVVAACATGADAHYSGSASLDAEPWRAWTPARQEVRGGAAGRDLEVGVAIGVPNPATPGAPATGATVFGSPGWYPIPAQPAEAPGYVSTFLRGPPSIQPIEPIQPINTFQPIQPSFSQPLQTFQPIQLGNQPASLEYQPQLAGASAWAPAPSSALPLQVREWEPAPALAQAPPPLPLLRAPPTGALLAPTPYTQRRVGAFRLRSDRGYQLQMEVPPAMMATPPGAPADGVLVMEMRATLYRPVG